MVVIPNGFDLEQTKFDPIGRKRIRAEFGIKDDELLIGTLGRSHPDKDFPTFFAMAKSVPNAKFMIVGEGVVSPNPNVITTGRRADTVAALSAMDIYVSSSLREGFSNSIAEAMACERPCVVTDAGDSTLIVGGQHVVPPGDPAALAEEVLRVMQSNGEALGKANRQRIQDHFSLPVVTKMFENLYLEVLAECAGSPESG